MAFSTSLLWVVWHKVRTQRVVNLVAPFCLFPPGLHLRETNHVIFMYLFIWGEMMDETKEYQLSPYLDFNIFCWRARYQDCLKNPYSNLGNWLFQFFIFKQRHLWWLMVGTFDLNSLFHFKPSGTQWSFKTIQLSSECFCFSFLFKQLALSNSFSLKITTLSTLHFKNLFHHYTFVIFYSVHPKSKIVSFSCIYTELVDQHWHIHGKKSIRKRC